MRKLFLNIILSLFVLLSCKLTACAYEFSADMYNNGQAGGKIFVKGPKVRINTPNNQQYIISRQDRNATYVIIPAQRMYMEQRFDPRSLPNLGANPGTPNYKKEFVKTENINGLSAKKYKITVDNSVSYQWFATGIPIPVKIQDLRSGTVVEYRNISSHVQDSVFELPAGYQKMQMPSMPGMNSMPNMPQSQNQMPNMNQLKNLKKFW